jgi:hypothetical protein
MSQCKTRNLWNSGRVSVCPRSLSNYYRYISIASAVICLPCIFAMIPGDPHAQRPQVPFSVHNSFFFLTIRFVVWHIDLNAYSINVNHPCIMNFFLTGSSMNFSRVLIVSRLHNYNSASKT